MGRVLHASYSGYFPFCIGTADSSKIGTFKPYPIAMELDDIMKAFWRVKKWKVNGIILNNKVAVPTYLKNGIPIQITEEKDLVCADGFSFLVFEEDEEGYPDRCEFFLDRLSEGYTVIKQDNSFYPRLMFGFIYVKPGEDAETVSSEEDWNTAPSIESSGTIDFMGYQITGFKVTGNGSYTGGSITPEEYWSYGGTYDTSTGEPL